MGTNNNKKRRTTQNEKKNRQRPRVLKTLLEIQAEVIGKTERTILYKKAGQHITKNDPVVQAMELIEEKTIANQSKLIEHLKEIVKL